MREVFDAADGNYGVPRMHGELRHGGVVVNEKRVRRLMRLHGMAGRCIRRRVRTTFPGPDGYTIPDLVGRAFTPGKPDVAWCQDITYIATGEGWLYLASVLDLGSRRLLGYSMADHMRTGLVLDALAIAVAARDGAVAGVIAHADRGSQYTSNDYLDHCQAHQLRASVGRVATCFDNAVAESFWASLKRECIRGHVFTTVPRPAGRSSAGSPGTTPNGSTPASTTPHPPHGNSSTIKRHNHPSAKRGDAQVDVTRWRPLPRSRSTDGSRVP